jgi:ribosomal protein L37AE/L43A
MTSEETPICGFGKSDGSMCLDERTGTRCPAHEALVCGGCHQHEATHECRHGDGVVLCEACGHISPTQHGPAVDPTARAEVEVDRQIEIALERLDATGVLPSTPVQRADAAVAIRRGLLTGLALQMLSGMARLIKEDL